MAFTRQMCRELSRTQVAIWSGGALGIDSAAHEGGLEGQGSTVVVLPSGLDYRYPKKNARLFDRICAEGGTLVSPFADADNPEQGSFFRRNAVLAACVAALVVAQCPVDSGARNAAGAARAFSKRVGAVLQAPWEPAGAGCAIELRLGAEPITSAADVLDLLGLPRHRASPSGAPSFQTSLFGPDPVSLLPADERPIAAAIRDGARHVDAICEALSQPAADVTRKLLSLVLRGAVIERPDGLALASGSRTRDSLGP